MTENPAATTNKYFGFELDEDSKLRQGAGVDEGPNRPKVYGPAATWYGKKWSELAWYEKIPWIAAPLDEAFTTHEPRTEKPPQHPWLYELAWILTRASLPIAVQAASYQAFPDYKWNAGWSYLFYWVNFVYFMISTIPHFNYYGCIYGYFDEAKRGRDRTPDKRLRHLTLSVLLFTHVRTALPFWVHWNNQEMPMLRWSSLPRMGAFLIVLDLLFYSYHRSAHEVPWLWKIHSQHHATKHPTALLALMADDVQEFLEVFLCPTTASLTVPMTFHELYLAICITVYVEIAGHTGIRARWGHPLLTPVLKPLGMDLAIEDHDLHHRYGKGGKNYGKQTRIYDVLFGTVAPREETKDL